MKAADNLGYAQPAAWPPGMLKGGEPRQACGGILWWLSVSRVWCMGKPAAATSTMHPSDWRLSFIWHCASAMLGALLASSTL